MLYLVVHVFNINKDPWEMTLNEFLFWVDGLPVIAKYIKGES